MGIDSLLLELLTVVIYPMVEASVLKSARLPLVLERPHSSGVGRGVKKSIFKGFFIIINIIKENCGRYCVKRAENRNFCSRICKGGAK